LSAAHSIVAVAEPSAGLFADLEVTSIDDHQTIPHQAVSYAASTRLFAELMSWLYEGI
jgi:hypothetical protein